jgi:hypothetical protein
MGQWLCTKTKLQTLFHLLLTFEGESCLSFNLNYLKGLNS